MSKKNKNTLVYKAKELLITDNRKYLKCNWSGFTQSLISTLENTTKVKLTLETYPLFKESLKSLFASFCFNQINRLYILDILDPTHWSQPARKYHRQ